MNGKRVKRLRKAYAAKHGEKPSKEEFRRVKKHYTRTKTLL